MSHCAFANGVFETILAYLQLTFKLKTLKD